MRSYRLVPSNVSGDLYHVWLSGDSMGASTEAGHLLTREQAEELGRAWTSAAALDPATAQLWARVCDEPGRYAPVPEPPVPRCGEPEGVPVPRRKG